MKKIFQIIFATGLLLLIQDAEAQTTIQNLSIKNFIVSSSVKAQKNDSAKPSFHTIIQLEGDPAPGSTVRQIRLNFYLDERGTTFRPSYDENTKIAQGHYPMSEFDKIYQLLKHKSNPVAAMFIDSVTNTTEIIISASGRIPLRL